MDAAGFRDLVLITPKAFDSMPTAAGQCLTDGGIEAIVPTGWRGKDADRHHGARGKRILRAGKQDHAATADRVAWHGCGDGHEQSSVRLQRVEPMIQGMREARIDQDRIAWPRLKRCAINAMNRDLAHRAEALSGAFGQIDVDLNGMYCAAIANHRGGDRCVVADTTADM